MSLYVHHVPGRLRVRTESFRCRASLADAARERLTALEGVSEVTINPRVGSITVRYQPGRCTQGQLLAVLEEAGCIGARRSAAPGDSAVAALFGKALIGALAQTVAQRSVQTLVGALR